MGLLCLDKRGFFSGRVRTGSTPPPPQPPRCGFYCSHAFVATFHVRKTSGEVLMTVTNDRTVESVEQDQTARMCRLILVYTFRKINQWLRTVGYRFKKKPNDKTG